MLDLGRVTWAKGYGALCLGGLVLAIVSLMVTSGSGGDLFARVWRWWTICITYMVAALVGLVELVDAVPTLGDKAGATLGSGTPSTFAGWLLLKMVVNLSMFCLWLRFLLNVGVCSFLRMLSIAGCIQGPVGLVDCREPAVG